MSDFDAILRAVRELKAATVSPAALPGAIQAFQQLIWNTEDWPAELSRGSSDVLRTLAYDLDHFVPDPVRRAEDRVYYGFDRAVEEIREALTRTPEFEGAA